MTRGQSRPFPKKAPFREDGSRARLRQDARLPTHAAEGHIIPDLSTHLQIVAFTKPRNRTFRGRLWGEAELTAFKEHVVPGELRQGVSNFQGRGTAQKAF